MKIEQDSQVVICPPCGENVGLPTKRGANKKNLFLPRLTAVLPPQGREMKYTRMTSFMIPPHPVPHDFIARSVTPQCFSAGYSGRTGFTLIELLVVVLIIGILAAVALPQYQKAVKRAQGREVIVAINALDKALAMYALTHGDTCGQDIGHCHQWEGLDIEIPHTQHFEQGGIGTQELTNGAYATFQSKTGDAELTVRWNETTGRRVSATCMGSDCGAYFDFAGTCTTETVKMCYGNPVDRPTDWDNCPSHQKSEGELTSCELDI